MFSSDISPGQHLPGKNTKKEEVEMIMRGFYQVLITVRGWCRLTSEKASRFQNTGREGVVKEKEGVQITSPTSSRNRAGRCAATLHSH